MTLWRCSDASEGKAKSISSLAAKALRMAAVGANSTAIKNHTWCTVTADGDVINANTGKVIAKAPLPPKPKTLAENGSGGGNEAGSEVKAHVELENSTEDRYNENGKEQHEIHNTYGGYLSTFTENDTVSKYNEIVSNGDKWLLDGFVRAVDNGDINVLVGVDFYIKTAREVDAQIVGITTGNGIRITGYPPHFVDRVIGQASESHSGMRTGVSVEDVVDTLLHGTPAPVSTRADGDIRQVLYGSRCQVTISVRDGRLIQTNPQ